MKKIILAIFLSMHCFAKSNAQFEVKSESVLMAIGYFYTAVEYLAPHNFSFEVGAGSRVFNPTGARAAHILAMTKYYFRTFRGHDELYIGLYGKMENKFFQDLDLTDGVDDSYRKTGPSLGFLLGRKWRSFNNKNITYDLQMGMGQFFGREVIFVRPGFNSNIIFFDPLPNLDFVFNFTVGYRFNRN